MHIVVRVIPLLDFDVDGPNSGDAALTCLEPGSFARALSRCRHAADVLDDHYVMTTLRPCMPRAVTCGTLILLHSSTPRPDPNMLSAFYGFGRWMLRTTNRPASCTGGWRLSNSLSLNDLSFN
ncbi:hypothetical protein EXIGLDRAFT_734157, partial [Exidia glandulosa HHB12029]